LLAFVHDDVLLHGREPGEGEGEIVLSGVDVDTLAVHPFDEQLAVELHSHVAAVFACRFGMDDDGGDYRLEPVEPPPALALDDGRTLAHASEQLAAGRE